MDYPANQRDEVTLNSAGFLFFGLDQSMSRVFFFFWLLVSCCDCVRLSRRFDPLSKVQCESDYPGVIAAWWHHTGVTCFVTHSFNMNMYHHQGSRRNEAASVEGSDLQFWWDRLRVCGGCLLVSCMPPGGGVVCEWHSWRNFSQRYH